MSKQQNWFKGLFARVSPDIKSHIKRSWLKFDITIGGNAGTKLMALIAATGIILAIHFNSIVPRELTIPVYVVNDYTNEVAFVSVEPEEIGIKLRGTEQDFNSIDMTHISAVVEFKLPQDKILEIQTSRSLASGSLQKADFNLSRVARITGLGKRSIQVDEFKDKFVSVTYDTAASIALTNKVIITAPINTDDAAQGFVVGDVSLATNNVVVVLHGSRYRLNELKNADVKIYTEPVDVSGKSLSFDSRVALRIPADWGITQYEPSNVVLHVEMHSEESSLDPNAVMPQNSADWKVSEGDDGSSATRNIELPPVVPVYLDKD